jgi:hypothetical protein
MFSTKTILATMQFEVRLEVLSAMKIQVVALWVMTLCGIAV